MTTKDKQAKIKALVIEMLDASRSNMISKIDHVLGPGAVDVDSWNEEDAPMVVPKCILTALMEHEATQYNGRGTSFEKQIKKDVRNIRYFLPF